MHNIKDKINYYTFIFFLSAISGWIGEIFWRLITIHTIGNPGILLGPWLPIYGVAGVFIFFFSSKQHNFFANVLKIFSIAALDEYLSALLSEMIFHHKIWDYSDKILNFQGRICLEMTLLFTIIGLFVVYFIKPIIQKFYIHKQNIIKYFNIILSILFIFNIIIQIIK